MKFRCFPRLYAALEKYARIFFVFLYAFIYCMVKEIETYKALKTYKFYLLQMLKCFVCLVWLLSFNIVLYVRIVTFLLYHILFKKIIHYLIANAAISG